MELLLFECVLQLCKQVILSLLQILHSLTVLINGTLCIIHPSLVTLFKFLLMAFVIVLEGVILHYFFEFYILTMIISLLKVSLFWFFKVDLLTDSCVAHWPLDWLNDNIRQGMYLLYLYVGVYSFILQCSTVSTVHWACFTVSYPPTHAEVSSSNPSSPTILSPSAFLSPLYHQPSSSSPLSSTRLLIPQTPVSWPCSQISQPTF